MAAAKVGGIAANNNYRADFIFENLAIQNNVIHGAFKAGVENLCFLGSSCIYPKLASQPIREEYLLSGPLENTNEPYAIAKISGQKLCEAFKQQYGVNYFSIMPTNLYGPNDNYHLENSHMVAALIRKAHEAKISQADVLNVWGSGNPRRELLFVDDLADFCRILLRQSPQYSSINVGTGTDLSVREIAGLIAKVVGFNGKLSFDPSKPDGTPQKLLDVSRALAMGWKSQTDLETGIASAYQDFKARFHH